METTENDRIERLVAVFRTLADPARLRILGLLAERPASGKDLAERLGLTPPTISHHMAKLVATGLVMVTPDAQRRCYALDQTALRGLAGAAAPTGEATPQETDAEGRERQKVLRDFFDGPRLKQIPAQRRKRVIVLQHLLERFAPDRDYPEREVNALLAEAHDDFATLRRDLVDFGYMTRDHGVYRVADRPRAKAAADPQP